VRTDDLKWWGRRERLAIAMLILVVVGGTAGYMVTEHWGVWDAFYMTLTTVTTVGFRDISRAGQVFTAVVIVAGVGTALYSLSLLIALVVDGRLYDRLEHRRRARMIDDLTGHFILCGFGRIGRIIAAEFEHRKVPFVVVDRDPEQCQQAIETGLLAVAADASNEEVLRRVGIERARGLIAAVGTDAENVYTVLSARLLNPRLFIVSRAEAEESRRRIERAGADRVLSPYQIGAVHLAQTALRPAVVDFIQLATSSANLELNMEQVPVAPDTTLDGQTIVEANLRQLFGVIVVGIQRADGHMDFNPAPEARMHGGDRLVVLGRAEGLRNLENLASQARRIQT
jgi:voltage-gated potassium channel